MKITELLVQENLPKKSLFNSSEVSALLKVKPHEIRYWENEFPQIRSQKNKHGQRLYRREDVIFFSAIKHLLQDKKFTVAGAIKVLADSDLMADRLAATQPAPILSLEAPSPSEDVLQDSLELLPDPDLAFDEMTQEIYQSCGEQLEQAVSVVEAKHVGEMIADAISHQASQEKQGHRISKLEYEKALATLIASKTELSDLLVSLERFTPNDFWGDFKSE